MMSGAGLWDPYLAPGSQFLKNISIPNSMPQCAARPHMLPPCPHHPLTLSPTHTLTPDLRHGLAWRATEVHPEFDWIMLFRDLLKRRGPETDFKGRLPFSPSSPHSLSPSPHLQANHTQGGTCGCAARRLLLTFKTTEPTTPR